ncbi:hypothetical protein [Nonlabens ponticola]|uniref:C1q domain-containing protein n=1 Tax=Nonlabens ponticola TaxID=2496866 RepID=A0A3S9MZE9_9FLAO|nr:hypothetical protein [Nonlabens ponticola]AZQ44538.1 hypothetical protein EJ995_09880 [Nonlabens ponticola]
MKHLYSTLLICLIGSFATAQVGLNTITPTADLEIVSKASLEAGEYNGVILPRVTALPVSGDATFPTANQRGLMLYLDTTDGTEGIYMFDGTQYIKQENAAPSSAFYNDGSTDFATTVDAEAFRTGRTRFGRDSSTAAIVTIENETGASQDRTTLSVTNRHTSSVGNSFGISINNTASSDNKVGILNNVSLSGDGVHTGIENIVAVRDDNAPEVENYGLKSVVGDAASTGTIYGVYSEVNSDAAATAYSGYFVGSKFGIRQDNTASSAGYDLTTDTGTAGQVLTTDGAGQATWADANTPATIYVKATGSQSSLSNPNQNNSMDDWNDLIYATEVVDDGSGYDNNTGIFTAPVDGIYQVNSMYVITSANATVDQFGIGIQVDPDGVGGPSDFDFVLISEPNHNGNGEVYRNLHTTVKLDAGARLKVQLKMPDNYGSVNLNTFEGKNQITIAKL